MKSKSDLIAALRASLTDSTEVSEKPAATKATTKAKASAPAETRPTPAKTGNPFATFKPVATATVVEEEVEGVEESTEDCGEESTEISLDWLVVDALEDFLNFVEERKDALREAVRLLRSHQ